MLFINDTDEQHPTQRCGLFYIPSPPLSPCNGVTVITRSKVSRIPWTSSNHRIPVGSSSIPRISSTHRILAGPSKIQRTSSTPRIPAGLPGFKGPLILPGDMLVFQHSKDLQYSQDICWSSRIPRTSSNHTIPAGSSRNPRTSSIHRIPAGSSRIPRISNTHRILAGPSRIQRTFSTPRIPAGLLGFQEPPILPGFLLVFQDSKNLQYSQDLCWSSRISRTSNTPRIPASLTEFQ